MTRKISPMAEMRKKYQEKVSKPPPAGRSPYPVEIRITILLIIGPLHGGGGITGRPTKDGCDNVIGHRNKAYHRKTYCCPEHAPLVAYGPRYKVNQHNTYAVKSVIED